MLSNIVSNRKRSHYELFTIQCWGPLVDSFGRIPISFCFNLEHTKSLTDLYSV